MRAMDNPPRTRSKGLLLALSIALFFCPPTAAQAFGDLESLESWVRLYYQNPKPEKLGQALVYYVSTPSFEEPRTQPPMAQFLGTALRDEPEIMESLFDAYFDSGGSDLERFLLVCLWLTDSKTGRNLLRQGRKRTTEERSSAFIDRLLHEKPKDFKRSLPEDVSEVHRILSAFYASGDTAYVRTLIDTLQLADRSNHNEIFVGRTAMGALTDLAMKHERALDYCKQRLRRLKNPERALLTQIIDYAERQNPSAESAKTM